VYDHLMGFLKLDIIVFTNHFLKNSLDQTGLTHHKIVWI
jgi:hypothetical protein